MERIGSTLLTYILRFARGTARTIYLRMSNALSTYYENIDSINQLHRIAIEKEKTGMEPDITDILHAELTLLVCAFDTFIHDVIADVQTDRLLNDKTWKKNLIFQYGEFHKYTFPKSKAIAYAFNKCNICDIWEKITPYLNESPAIVQQKLDEMVHECDLIAHQANKDSETRKKRSITFEYLENSKSFLTQIAIGFDQMIKDIYFTAHRGK